MAKAFQQALAKERSRRAAVAESSGGGEGELLDMDGKPLQLLTPDGRPMVYRAEASLQPEFEDFRDSFQGSLAAGGADGDLMGGSFGGANMMMEKKNNNNYNNNMTMNSTITSSINPLADAQQLDADGRPLTYRAGPSLQPEFEDFRDSFQGSSSIDDLFTASNEYTARDGAYATQ